MAKAIWFLVFVPVSLYFISTYFKPLNGVRNLRALATGVLGLANAALLVRTTYTVVFASLPHPGMFFRMASGLLGGMFVTMLLSMGFRQAPKVMLIAAGILFVASSLIVILATHKLGRTATQQPIPGSLNFYILESNPVGLAIPAIILIWHSRRKKGTSGTPDCEPTDRTDANEQEMGT